MDVLQYDLGSAGLSEETAMEQATRKKEGKQKRNEVGSGGRRFSKGEDEGSPLSDLNGFRRGREYETSLSVRSLVVRQWQSL